MEESMRQLRLSSFTFNRLVRQLDRSRIYTYSEFSSEEKEDTRVRQYKVSEAVLPFLLILTILLLLTTVTVMPAS